MFAFPLSWFATAVVLGALCSASLSSREHIGVIFALAAFTCVLCRCKPPAFRAAVAATLALATLYAFYRAQTERDVVETRTMRFTGIVEERRVQSGLGEYRLALADGRRATFSSHQDAEPGDTVVVRGRLAPFDTPRNPGEPSEREIEREAGVDARIESAQILSHLAVASTLPVRVIRAKAWALKQLRMRLGEPSAEIVAGELWGERGALPPDLRSEFQETGTVHVLVTAGLHVGLVAALIAVFCSLCSAPRFLACFIAIVSVWLFASVSGLHVPALRAATMATAALLARACGRATMSWQGLCAAAIVIVAVAPSDVTSASFWLSFCCVAAIFSLASRIDAYLHVAVAQPRVREALVLTVATQLGTWPITAAAFLQFTPYAFIANIAVVPCVPVTMALGAAQLLFAWLPPCAQAIANLNSWALAWTIGIVRTFSALPGASIVMTPAPPWVLALYEIALAACISLARRGAGTFAAASLICITALALSPPGWDAHRLKITVLDVGQADAIVIETPAHHAILIDAGGRLERGAAGSDSEAEQIGERIVVPFLLRAGIHALDAVILSHPHGDHAGGVAPVLRKLTVAEFADGGQRYGGHAYHDAVDVARREGVPMIYPRAGMEWRTDDGVVLHFIGPVLPFIGGRNAINDNSVAFMLAYRHFRMLFTGDAGSAAEQRFLGEGIDLHADVLKVGHHGSAYGSTAEFIAAVHPRYAMISVGRHNLFGHPAPSTVETLERAGATVYRTDMNGAITASTDGSATTIDTMLR
ncbi:MAG: DNA internalization-related competence protein ComEC/Rec2 [Candidatus Eremiobacteraeota bacterium]|nr:DNA internalization-related competence protein ComEC/Rec2 [Candidatus Eremiobacteraeota bacterium]